MVGVLILLFLQSERCRLLEVLNPSEAEPLAQHPFITLWALNRPCLLLLITSSVEGEGFSNHLHPIGHVKAIFWDKMAALFFLGSRVKLKKLSRMQRTTEANTPRNAGTTDWEQWHQDPLRTGWGAENAKVWEDVSLGEAQWHHPAFLVASIY